MEKSGWKRLAIVMMCLFILTWIMIFGLMSVGADMLEKETKCANEVCFQYESYYYDDETHTCSCFGDGEIAKQEIID